jgi:hypothetical protein
MHHTMKSYASLSLVILLFLSSALSQQQKCNGFSELCSKPYHQITFPCTHNAYSFVPNNPASNQAASITTQLKDGVRAFMLDGHKAPTGAGVNLCHGSCFLLNAGNAVQVLKEFTTFLDANPNEVLTIIWENAGKLDPSLYKTAYQQAGLEKYSYTQPSAQQTWPTLSNLISSGKKVINFIDTGASDSVPW